MNTSLALEEAGTACNDHGPGPDIACAENAQLGKWVLKTVRSWDEASLKTARLDAAHRTIPPGMLLALIVYCYASGIYASGDIEARLQRGEIIRLLCGSEPVDRRRILRFRRDNASIVTSCLERTLSLAFSGQQTSAMPHRRTMIESGISTLATQESFAAEAQRRVRWAMFLDSVAQDD